jgi:hypothetical protein
VQSGSAKKVTAKSTTGSKRKNDTGRGKRSR